MRTMPSLNSIPGKKRVFFIVPVLLALFVHLQTFGGAYLRAEDAVPAPDVKTAPAPAPVPPERSAPEQPAQAAPAAQEVKESAPEPYDSEAAKDAVVIAAVKADWKKIVEVAPALLEKAPDTKDKFTVVLAYAYFKTGDNARALKLLEGRTDAASQLLAAAIQGKEIIPAGAKDPVKKAFPFFIEVSANKNGFNLGIFPKAAVKLSLRKAFYSTVTDANLQQLENFDSRILPKESVYFVAGDVVLEKKGKSYAMAFVDVGRMGEDLGLEKKGKDIRIGLLTRRGSDAKRKNLQKALTAAGFNVDDMGRGDFYSLGDKAKLDGLLVELVEDTRVSAGVLKSNFKNIEASISLTIYNTQKEESLSELKEHSSIVHLDEDQGKELALAKSYENVSRELRDTLSDYLNKIDWVSAGTPPLTVTISSEKVFSNNFRFYAKGSLGEITFKNNTERPVTNVKASFFIKKYMDFPTQTEIGVIAPKATVKKSLNAVFNESVIDIMEDTFLQSEVKVTYVNGVKEDTATLNHPVYVYERHALIWDDKGRVASFVTPKDQAVLDFVTQAVSGYRTPKLNKNLVVAKALFEAMGTVGIQYVENPNPYQVVSSLNVVDFVQFPRETLTRKAGNCSDLTSLYSSLLESVGIKTKPIDAPGHLYMMFDTEIPADEQVFFGFPQERYIISDGTVWIPVETTLVGSSFTKAWKKGIEEFTSEKNSIKLVDLRDAWQLHSPPNMAPIVLKERVTKDEIEKKFPGELESMTKERQRTLTASLEGMDPEAMKMMMEVTARDGLLDVALEAGRRLQAQSPDAGVYNNLANIHYLKGEPHEAIVDYKKALELDPDDAGIWINLARPYIKKGMKKEAKEALDKAISLDPAIKDRYIGVFMELEK